MIQIKNLTVKNFMSVGNATQGVNVDRRSESMVDIFPEFDDLLA